MGRLNEETETDGVWKWREPHGIGNISRKGHFERKPIETSDTKIVLSKTNLSELSQLTKSSSWMQELERSAAL